jgi:hypothetical protein
VASTVTEQVNSPIIGDAIFHFSNQPTSESDESRKPTESARVEIQTSAVPVTTFQFNVLNHRPFAVSTIQS